MKRTILSWSGGKDAAWALHLLRQDGDIEVVGLLTTVHAATGRVAMHDVRRTLLEAQAATVGLPLQIVPVPWPCPNTIYEMAMRQALEESKRELAITHIAFGDLNLEDIRRYREQRIETMGLTPLFPLWGQPTKLLASQMIAQGLRAALVCVDLAQLPGTFAGLAFEEKLLARLPSGVDPCGEGGEFHTFVWDGPMFALPLPITVGAVSVRDGFIFADLSPQQLPKGRSA